MAPKKTPQELINQFWEKTVLNTTNPSVVTTLPQSIFAEGFKDQVSQNPGVAESVLADYERAVEKCKAKVDRIAKESRLSNQKYNDPDFDLWNFGYCLRPLSTYVPPEKGAEEAEPEELQSSAPKLTLYVDERAPINLTQLIAPQDEEAEDGDELSPGYQPQSVKRTHQIFDKPEFFVDGASADDVRQGASGDCWFLSAMSALSHMKPNELGNLVERVCVHRDEAAGVYGFVFYRDGEWRSQIIDDKLYLKAPDYKDIADGSEMTAILKYFKEKDRSEQYRKIVQSNSDALFYARSAHKYETWVPLLEKAYAKAHGDYTAIEGGKISDGIEDLTGGLASFYMSGDIVDLDKFWEDGLALVNQNFLWGCGTSNVNSFDGRGIVGGHAYAILEAKKISTGTRLLKVRNPWGESEWEGDWSDRSKKWTDELKKEVKLEDKDDGIFWISYEDLLRNYPYLYRTRMFDASWMMAQLWTNFTVPLLSSDTYERTFKFTLTKAATTVLVLSQLDTRYFRGLNGQYEYGLSFRLHKLDEEDYLHRCNHRHFNDRSINLEIDLEAGVYEVRLKITSDRYPDRPKIEDVVRVNWKSSRDKLLQICRSYDLAHAKVAAPEQQVKDEKAGEKSEEKPVEPKTEGKTDKETSEKVGGTETESKPIDSDAKSDSPVQVPHPDQKSDSDTISTEPELIEKPDAQPGSEAKTEKEKPEDTTAPPSLPGQFTDTEPPKSIPSSITGPQSSAKPPSDGPSVGAEVITDAAGKKDEKKKDDKKKDDKKKDDKKKEDKKKEDDNNDDKGEDDDQKEDDGDKPTEGEDTTEAASKDKDGGEDEDDNTLDEPFMSVCTVGLRVYCKDTGAHIEMMKDSTALVQQKQFTSSREAQLDVEDIARP